MKGPKSRVLAWRSHTEVDEAVEDDGLMKDGRDGDLMKDGHDGGPKESGSWGGLKNLISSNPNPNPWFCYHVTNLGNVRR